MTSAGVKLANDGTADDLLLSIIMTFARISASRRLALKWWRSSRIRPFRPNCKGTWLRF